MKKTITISIDTEAWINAKKKTDNISGLINDLLFQWLKLSPDIEKNTSKQLDLAKIQVSTLEAEIARLKKSAEKKDNDKSNWDKSTGAWRKPKYAPGMLEAMNNENKRD